MLCGFVLAVVLALPITVACRRMLPVLRLRQAIALARCWPQFFFVLTQFYEPYRLSIRNEARRFQLKILNLCLISAVFLTQKSGFSFQIYCKIPSTLLKFSACLTLSFQCANFAKPFNDANRLKECLSRCLIERLEAKTLLVFINSSSLFAVPFL